MIDDKRGARSTGKASSTAHTPAMKMDRVPTPRIKNLLPPDSFSLDKFMSCTDVSDNRIPSSIATT